MKRILLLLILCLVTFVQAEAKIFGKKSKQESARTEQTNDDVVMKRVYMFGFSASFTDSVAYVTDIQPIDSAYIHKKNGFLCDRTLYGVQLFNHTNDKLHQQDPICVVFFNPKKQKLEKQYQKVLKRYQQDPNVLLKVLRKEEFAFYAEEFIDPNALAVTEEETAPAVEYKPAEESTK